MSTGPRHQPRGRVQLDLVRRALDEIDDRPIDVTARRVARIASLLGETVLAVELGLELKPTRGHPPANAEDTRRLMADPSLWGQPDGPADRAMLIYLANRQAGWGDHEGKLRGDSLAEIEMWLATFEQDHELADAPGALSTRLLMLGIREQVRHSAFAALCSWERQLTYANVNEQIFDRFRSNVDSMLAHGAPDVLDQFSAVFRRLHDVSTDPNAPVAEELAQAVTTCRRILKAVADHLLPGTPGAESESGHSLDDSAYKNRFYEYLKVNVASQRTREAVAAAVGGIYERFASLDNLASKGVHADIGLAAAELCAINTYVLAGELLRAS